MKKIKRNFATTPNKTNSIIGKFDFTYKGFAMDHKEKMIYVLANTDTEIRKGNMDLLDKYIALVNKYPSYRCAVLNIMFYTRTK